MTIQDYQALTGVTVSDEDTNRVKAVIRRCEAKLGGLLGYSLSKQKTWTELGKVQFDGHVPFPSLPVSDDVKDNLLPADESTGDYQLFNFDELDKHLKINPAKEVYRAKLVLPVSEDEFITITDLENVTPYLNGAGLVTAITRYHTWFTWAWYSALTLPRRAGLMLAVEADYVNLCDLNEYEDIAYLLSDMVTYYSDPNYSLLGVVKSETVDSHSYSRASTGQTPDSMAPEGQASAKQIIAKYAGPAAFRKLVA